MNDFKAKILAQEMTRKQFLQYVGASLLFVFGFGNFIHYFKELSKTNVHGAQTSHQDLRRGFGSSKFGV